jgi:hypothetical protein
MRTLKMIDTKVTTKHCEKWEHCDAAATAQTAMGCYGVLHIWEDLGTDASSEEQLGTIVGSKTMVQTCKQTAHIANKLPYSEIDRTTWIERLQSAVATATLYEGSTEGL